MGVDIGRNEVSAREHYEAIKENALAGCVDVEPTALRECVIEAAEAAQHQSESRQDLYAQQDMSRWAFWMMVIAGLTLLVTALGIAWIRDTLIETRRAVRSADDAVRVTREIGEAQVRAYVSVDDVEVTVEIDDERVLWNVAAKVSNSGQSPAISVGLTLGGDTFEQSAISIRRDISAKNHAVFPITLVTRGENLTFFDRDKTRSGLLIWATVSYADIFQKPRTENAQFLGTIFVDDGETTKLARVDLERETPNQDQGQSE